MQNAHEMTRDKLFTMRVSEPEGAEFERVAAHHNTNVAGVIRLLMKRELQTIADTERKAWRQGADGWERDKVFLEFLADKANIMHLEVRFDDKTRTVMIHSPMVPPKETRSGLTRHEAINALATWRHSDIVEVDPDTREVVLFPKGSTRTKKVMPPREALDDEMVAAFEKKKAK